MTITATDIEEHREERPRLYGYFYGKYSVYPFLLPQPLLPEDAREYTAFTIPSAAEQELMEEREQAYRNLKGFVMAYEHCNALDEVDRITAIDRQLAELRGGK